MPVDHIDVTQLSGEVDGNNLAPLMRKLSNCEEECPTFAVHQVTEGACARGRLYEYTSAANPDMNPIPFLVHPPELHQSGETRVVPFDLSKEIGTKYTATSPNLLASYLRIKVGESLQTKARATSQAFYIIRGSGNTRSEHDTVHWKEGDLFVLPLCEKSCMHTATSDAAVYWVNDEPLLRYLGVKPCEKKFDVTIFRKEQLLSKIEEIRHDPESKHRNRLGVLLGNQETDDNTKTLTHTLWSLLNTIPGNTVQPPHRHNSVALDLCVSAEEGVYTLMGPELDENGWVKNPVRADWAPGAAFVTPPGWWHSHHNESGKEAWVLPLQDAGLYTHMRTLDIKFSSPIVSYEECLKGQQEEEKREKL